MHLNIYGDNIIECERALNILIEGIAINETKQLKIEWNLDNIVCPSVKVLGNKEYIFTLYTGVNKTRWNVDVYRRFVTDKGGLLNEGADALITKLKENNEEESLLAFEFSNALPAGNNAWQRSGRSLSLSQAKIPYLYVAELGGNELNKDGSKKSMRLPNSTVILSYILNSIRRKIPNAIIYKMSPVADNDTKVKYKDIVNNNNSENLSYKIINEEIINNNYKMYEIISKKEERLEKSNFINLNGSQMEDEILRSIKKKNISWKKRLKIDKYGKRFLNFNNTLSKYAISIFSEKSLPFTLLPKENLDLFINDYKTVKNYSKGLIQYLNENSEKDIVFCLVNGFKPSGEDSRPDRGLIPFVRMILGSQINIVTVIYGPIPKVHLEKLKNKEYSKLTKENGLFSAIMGQSNLMLILSPDEKEVMFSSDTIIKAENKMKKYEVINKLPKKFTEMDVDTIIHLLFTQVLNDVFESFCNPPGGDWSGISIIQNNNEYRWLSLERAPKNMKRPDHVLQFYKENPSVILSIESKDSKGKLMKSEESVGPKMVKYLHNLKKKVVNAEKKLITSSTYKQSNKIIHKQDFLYKSGVAYIENNCDFLNRDTLKNIKETCMVDFVLAFNFSKKEGGDEVEVNLFYYNEDSIMQRLLFDQLNKLTYSFKNFNVHVIE